MSARPRETLASGILALVLASSASASLETGNVEACVFSHADCVANFVPGTNYGGTFNPFDGDATIDSGLEFSWISDTGNTTHNANFDEDSLRLSIRNNNFISSVTIPGGQFGWVFVFTDRTILDVEVDFGRTLALESVVFDSDRIAIELGATTIPSLGTVYVDFTIIEIFPVPPTPVPPLAPVLIGGTAEACVFSHADCLANFVPGTNYGGTLDPFDGDATIDSGLEFSWISDTGNTTHNANFDEDSLSLSIRNNNFLGSVTIPGGEFGWVFAFTDRTILDIEVDFGRTLALDSVTFDANSLAIELGATTIASLKTVQVDFTIAASLDHAIRSPVRGDLRVTGVENSDCLNAPNVWTFCQHQTGYHRQAGGIRGADDTYAWDLNLSGNLDKNRPVYPVAAGTVVKYAGEVAPQDNSSGAVLIQHSPSGVSCDAEPERCWWSGYLHLENIAVTEDKEVGLRDTLGRVGDVSPFAIPAHLHLVVYEGENKPGLLKSVDAVIPEPDMGLLHLTALLTLAFCRCREDRTNKPRSGAISGEWCYVNSRSSA